jgi:glycosyltransferase involved in cell wall biosynthesis
VPAADLPAYRFQSPCEAQLVGLAPQLRHWPWQDPPDVERVPPIHVENPKESAVTTSRATRGAARQPDLVVLSHLRWTWVWQRPQHLISRLAAARARAGARTWFVEEPAVGDVTSPQLAWEERDGISRVWLLIPPYENAPDAPGFDAPGAESYGDMLADFLEAAGAPPAPDVWLYTPMAFDLVQSLRPARLVYDVMDDLASFLKAPEGLRLRQRRALSDADVVFTGGRSLHRGVTQVRRGGVHLFPSGVETAHYAASRVLRSPHDRRVAGYVGVIDERVDLDLVGRLAAELPDWTVRIVGPIAKIQPGALPQAPNLEYPGMVAYDDLPATMAGFDVALMPFALNEATRSISPTKTLEYLAAGLPVVSTRVPDVVADYDGIVHLADDAPSFAVACREVVGHSRTERDQRLSPILRLHEWDVIAASMASLIDALGEHRVVDLRESAGVTA